MRDRPGTVAPSWRRTAAADRASRPKNACQRKMGMVNIAPVSGGRQHAVGRGQRERAQGGGGGRHKSNKLRSRPSKAIRLASGQRSARPATAASTPRPTSSSSAPRTRSPSSHTSRRQGSRSGPGAASASRARSASRSHRPTASHTSSRRWPRSEALGRAPTPARPARAAPSQRPRAAPAGKGGATASHESARDSAGAAGWPERRVRRGAGAGAPGRRCLSCWPARCCRPGSRPRLCPSGSRARGAPR